MAADSSRGLFWAARSGMRSTASMAAGDSTPLAGITEMTGFGNASQIVPARPFQAAAVRFGERRSQGKGKTGSYWLLLVFVFLLYLNVPFVLPAVEQIHPAKIVAGLALLTLLGETMFARGAFQLGWPEGGLLIGFL